jgi:hypothetical protein
MIKLFAFITVLAIVAIGAPRIVGSPEVTDFPDSAQLSFQVSEECDVTIDIITDSGKVIRSIVSSVLGVNPLSPLIKNSLNQKISWDKKDNHGAVWNKTYLFRLRIGLTPKFDRFFGWNPQNEAVNANGWVRGLGVDSSGNLIMVLVTNRQVTRMIVYGSDGKYVRSLSMYPSDVPQERIGGYGMISASDSQKYPIQYLATAGSVIPGMQGQNRHSICIDGSRLVMPNGQSKYFYTGGLAGGDNPTRRIVVRDLEGTLQSDGVYGPAITTTAHNSPVFLALSPDRRYVYISTDHAIRRAPIGDTGLASIWLGTPGISGTGVTSFDSCAGISVDGADNLGSWGNRVGENVT